MVTNVFRTRFYNVVKSYIIMEKSNNLCYILPIIIQHDENSNVKNICMIIKRIVSKFTSKQESYEVGVWEKVVSH